MQPPTRKSTDARKGNRDDLALASASTRSATACLSERIDRSLRRPRPQPGGMPLSQMAVVSPMAAYLRALRVGAVFICGDVS
jgi:hypothetical protein